VKGFRGTGGAAKQAVGALALCTTMLGATSCAGTPPPKAPRERWTPGLEQLIPADLDLVAKINWAEARDAKVDDAVKQVLRDSELSGAVLDAIEGCLSEAETLRIAVRLGPNGLDGDVMAVVTGLPKAAKPGQVPCEAKGWKHTGTKRELEVFEPVTRSAARSAGALMLRSERGGVAVVTPGQVDALLRVLRDGPDGERLDPKGDGVLVLQAKINDTLLPDAWKAQAPALSDMAYGLREAQIRVQVTTGIKVRAALTYVDDSASDKAGQKLHEVRDAILESDRPDFVSVAKSAHASVQGELLRLELTIPKYVGSPPVPGRSGPPQVAPPSDPDIGHVGSPPVPGRSGSPPSTFPGRAGRADYR
jgi:hypothetical protein